MSDLNMFQKIKLFFTTKDVIARIMAGPKSSFLSGEFWAKVAAGAVTFYITMHTALPPQWDIYVTVGLALWISIERVYLKKKHMDALVDLSGAPAFDPNQLTQVLNTLIDKYPKLAPAKEVLTDVVVDITKPLASAAPSSAQIGASPEKV